MSNKKTYNDVYIFYSGATDKTGKALKEELGIKGGTTAPKTKMRVLIGWGAKTDKDITLNATTILNHPNAIRKNRNKLTTLTTLQAAGVNVADFVEAKDVLNALKSTQQDKKVIFPLIGRTKYHQGGKGFWMCLDKGMVDDAIKEGAQYFQERIAIADEYRLHIFQGELLYAQKKVKRDNAGAAFIEQQEAKLANAAERGKKKLDKDTKDFILNRLAKDQAEHADMVVRSNTRGWKFSQIKNSNVKTNLLEQAVNALSAIGLQFGAVDCCIDQDGKPWIIEINSGPGLDGTPFKTYITAFNHAFEEKKIVKKVATKTNATVAQAIPDLPPSSGKSKKLTLKEKLAMLSEMAEVADEDEAAALDSIASKMFGGQ